MTFAAPIFLFALALIPLAVAASLIARRRARRFAIRFPATGTALLAQGRSSPLRHLPAALLLGALAALALALARPHVSYATAARAASIVLVSDESGSMASTDVSPTRLAATERAANTFIDQIPGAARIGAVAFSTQPNTVQAPSTDHALARAVIDSQTAGGGTDTGDALALALQMLGAARHGHPVSAIVLLSDGAANLGQSPLTVAHEAAVDGVPIYTVALGTPGGTLPSNDPFSPPIPVPPDPQLMRQIAAASGGRSFNAQTADELSSIYRSLGTRLGSVTRRRDVTAEFAIGAAALLLLAGAGALRWSPRLP